MSINLEEKNINTSRNKLVSTYLNDLYKVTWKIQRY